MSAPIVLVIADTIPVVLLAVERMEIYKAKSAVNHITDHFREKNDDGTMKNGHGLVENLDM